MPLRLNLSKENIKLISFIFLSTTLMRLIYDYVYSSQISVLYNYAGFLNEFEWGRCIVSWFFMYSLLPFVIACVKVLTFSSIALYLLYFAHFVPGCIFISYMDIQFMWIWYIYYLLLFTFFYFFRFPQLTKNHFFFNKRIIYFIITLFSIVVVFIWLYYAHGRIQIGFDDVYAARLEARGFGMPMLLRYIFSSVKKVMPLFAVWALKNNNLLLTFWFSVIQLLIFFTDGSKSTFFLLIVAFAGYLFLKNNLQRIKLVPLFFSLLGIVSILEYNLFNKYIISGIFIRRVMFVPQNLNIYYYDFFTSHSPDFFQGSLLKIIGFESEYGSIARMIGYYFSGSNDLAANNGLFSDAYANLGFSGVFIMPFLIVLLLKVFDQMSSGLELATIIGAIPAFVSPLISASFFTLFLSHGVISMLLFFYFLPRDDTRIKT